MCQRTEESDLPFRYSALGRAALAQRGVSSEHSNMFGGSEYRHVATLLDRSSLRESRGKVQATGGPFFFSIVFDQIDETSADICLLNELFRIRI